MGSVPGLRSRALVEVIGLCQQLLRELLEGKVGAPVSWRAAWVEYPLKRGMAASEPGLRGSSSGAAPPSQRRRAWGTQRWPGTGTRGRGPSARGDVRRLDWGQTQQNHGEKEVQGGLGSGQKLQAPTRQANHPPAQNYTLNPPNPNSTTSHRSPPTPPHLPQLPRLQRLLAWPCRVVPEKAALRFSRRAPWKCPSRTSPLRPVGRDPAPSLRGARD